MASLSHNLSKKAIQSPGGAGAQSSKTGGGQQALKFARRTSSGRHISLSKEEPDMTGEMSGNYMNYTVQIPATPDNQPMDASSVAVKAEEKYVSNSLFSGGFGSLMRAHLMDKVIDSEVNHPQMTGSKGSSCSMPACDGKVMRDERCNDVDPCHCRYPLFFSSYF